MHVEAININIILKRLEVIKNVIALQDVEDITYQADKLRNLELAELDKPVIEDIKTILNLIDKKTYGDAMQVINKVLQHYNTIAKWKDPEIEGLQAEIRILSKQITNLEAELTDIEKIIHEFEIKHTEVLGETILNLLSIRKKLTAKKAKESPQDSQAQEKYKEAETEEQQYKGTFEETKNNPIQQLSPDEEQELKTLFRKISKLTHPDCVDKIFEKQAAELFIKAKEAKNNNDLKTLKQVHDYLINGTPFTLKDTINEKAVLKQEAANLRSVIEQLLEKINAVKNSDTYKTIAQIGNWDNYLIGIKTKLQDELEKLEKQYHEQ